MVGPASTSAATASAASGQRKFKSCPGLLWVCMLGTVLVLLAQPYGASADTTHHQRRKLVKTTDAARNQVLTKRAFVGPNAMSTNNNNNNNADELAAAVAEAGGRRLKSSKNSKSADVKSSDVYSASSDSDSKSSKASKNSKSSDVQSSSVYASSSTSSKGSKAGKSSKSSKGSKGSKGSSSTSGSGDDDDDDDDDSDKGTGDDHKKPDRDDDDGTGDDHKKNTGDDHKKSPTKKSPPPKKSPTKKSTKKSEPKKSHSKDDDKDSTGNDYDDGEQFFCDGFDPSDNGDSGDDDYTKFRVRFEYEFYDDEDDLMDFEMDLAKFVSKEVMDGCMRRRSLRTGAAVERGLGSEDVLGLDSNPPDTVVDDCDTEKKCHHVKGKMTVYVANDAKKAKVGCSVVESIAEYMSKSKDAMFVDSATCDISKGRSSTTLQPRSAGVGVGGKVAGALAALAVAMAGMFACRQTQKKRSEQRADEEEYNDYVGKLQNDSLDTYSVASTQDGSVINNKTIPESPPVVQVKALDPIGEGPDDASAKFCPCPTPFDEKGDLILPLQDEEKACHERCCGTDAIEEMNANIAACGVAAATCCAAAGMSDDIKENFKACNDHAEHVAGEVADHIKEAIEDDVALVEENTTRNMVDLGDDMVEDATAFPGMAAEAGAAAVAAIGAGAVAAAAAAAKAASNEEADDGATHHTQDVDTSFEDSDEEAEMDEAVPPPPPKEENEDEFEVEEEFQRKRAYTLDDDMDEESLKSLVNVDFEEEEEPPALTSASDEESPRNKEEIRESALDNIDEALKSANWVGVLEVANEMSREEDTDATDSDEEQQPSDCGIGAEQLGELNDSIVAAGSLIDEKDVAPLDEAWESANAAATPAMDVDEEEAF